MQNFHFSDVIPTSCINQVFDHWLEVDHPASPDSHYCGWSRQERLDDFCTPPRVPPTLVIIDKIIIDH